MAGHQVLVLRIGVRIPTPEFLFFNLDIVIWIKN